MLSGKRYTESYQAFKQPMLYVGDPIRFHGSDIYITCITIKIIWTLTCCSDTTCRICVVQVQPRKPVLDRPDSSPLSRQDELDHTDQENICPERTMS